MKCSGTRCRAGMMRIRCTINSERTSVWFESSKELHCTPFWHYSTNFLYCYLQSLNEQKSPRTTR